MTLDYENESGYKEPFDLKALALTVAQACLDETGCPFEASVNLLVTGDEEIRGINRQYRDIDAVTDVLSFPLLEYEEPGDYSFLENDPAADHFDPDSGELMLGDIVIDLERCAEQAAGYGHSLRREFAFLVAHSMLHLAGYDHMTPEEEGQMFALQEKILNRLGILRDSEDGQNIKLITED